eukprot:scaffold18475_cov51-Phaeocystis_antarctica.AAC.3
MPRAGPLGEECGLPRAQPRGRRSVYRSGASKGRSKLAFKMFRESTGLVRLRSPEVQGSFASLLGRSGPRLGQGSHFLSPLVRPRGSRHIPENPESDHTGRRTERSRTRTMRTRFFERQRRPHSRRSTQAQAAHGG